MKHAAIAQPVERILGKDEVASSNLASSSKKSVIPTGMADFLLADTDFYWRSQFKSGERRERCRGQGKRPERVAAVGRCQGAPSTQADAGHRKRTVARRSRDGGIANLPHNVQMFS